jgi:DNA polymerase III subunit epsilon
MSIKILSFDTETSGLDAKKNGIHQIAGKIYVDYKLEFEFYQNVKLMPGDQYDIKSLEVSGKTVDDIMSDSHCNPKALYKSLVNTLSKFCDKYKKDDKIFLMGYNNQSFDNPFLREFFAKNGDNYFYSWFWSAGLDVMVLAQQYLIADRHLMPNFQLGTVASHMGFDAEEKELHNAYFDLNLHEEIYQKITGQKLLQ